MRDRLEDALVRHVLATALSAGADFAELYAEGRRTRSLRLEDRRVEELSTGRDVGAGIRVVRGSRVGYAYTNLLDRGALTDAAKVAAAAAQGEGSREPADLTRPDRRVEHPVRKPPHDTDAAGLVELAQRAETAARDVSPEIAQVVVVYGDVEQEVVVVNSDGRAVDDRRVRTRLVTQAVATRDGLIQTGYESAGASAGHEVLDNNPPETVGAAAGRQAVTMLDSRPAPSGEMPVVMWRGHGGVLFHEACGHGMEADFVGKDATVFAGRQGQRVGSELLNGVDDATVQNGWGSFAFDDEGTPAQRTVMFQEGVLSDYLTDRRSSHRLSAPATGNGRRESYAHLPVPRMTNTYITAGASLPDDAVASLDRGILCKGIGGGQVNPATGDFVFGMTEAYLVEDGEIVHPVRGANLVGNGLQILADVDIVCNDVAFLQGMCGKDGQSVAAGIGAPTLRIGRITIGGTA
ncbi:MAG: TldD/PmbA family protein [Actinobacteria bacterium]|nr:TldD/PmbA family protein [Actinomycetota bacterium]